VGRPGSFWICSSIAIISFSALATIFWTMMLKKRELKQELQQARIERELRHERNSLEERIVARTAELQFEIVERQRAQQLNLGHNRAEMLTREEPTNAVVKILVEVVASDHSSLCCALHLIEAAALVLKASHSLPASFLRSLKQLNVDMTDCQRRKHCKTERLMFLPI
jgi:hypothetical protein